LAITNNGTNVTLYKYDAAGQLTNEVAFTNGLSGRVTNAWVYDEAGNWLNADGSSRWVYSRDNELMGRTPAASATNTVVTVTGTVDPGPQSNKWYHTTASCRGVSGWVSPVDGAFSLPNVPIYPGTNQLLVTVTDVSGNQYQQTRTVTKTNCQESFHYDGNGNLTNWVSGTTNWVYEWDWADRLTKVTSNQVVVLENWYDGNSRRIAKRERCGSDYKYIFYVWDGWGSVAVLSTNGATLETFTRGVGLAGDIGTLVAVTHHAGSSTNGTFYAHHNHRGDIVLTRSGTMTVGSYEYSAFGNLKLAIGNDICRFKFSSKEREASCGFSYYGYRFYAPQWQRWVSRDPCGEVSFENLYHPANTCAITGSDPYAYVRNDPVTLYDPLGLDWADRYTKCLQMMDPWGLCPYSTVVAPGSYLTKGLAGKICRRFGAVAIGWCTGISYGCMITALEGD